MTPLKTSLDVAYLPPEKRARSDGAEPFRIVDKRSSYGFNNTLIEAAIQTPDRETQTLVDYDFHRTISVIGRRTLLSLGRTMYWRMPQLAAAINEQAFIAAVPFNPIFQGKNSKWGEQAREWLDNWHQVMDMAGWQYDYECYCQNLLRMGTIDGDIGTVLTQDESGNPKILVIPSHRIGSRYQTGGVCKVAIKDGKLLIDDVQVDEYADVPGAPAAEWEAPIIDGVVLDFHSRPIAYRVYYDPIVSAGHVDISARNMFLTFDPLIPGQVRGISLLASSVFDWQDVREFRRFEMLAQKTFASKTIVEENETGDTDSARAIVANPAQFDVNGNETAPNMLKLDKGAYTYFKSQTGSKLTAFNYGERPGRSTQEFLDGTVRDGMRGLGWDMFFSTDPKSVGGAPMRVIVDRVNRTVKQRRKLIGKTILRVDVYALAKAIQSGQLPMDDEWFKWNYRGQADLTADRRYETQTDKEEHEQGFINMEDVEARREGDWKARRDQREKEVMDLYDRAKRVADKYKISIQEAANRMSLIGNNNFTMARRDTGTDALETDTSQDPLDQTPNQK